MMYQLTLRSRLDILCGGSMQFCMYLVWCPVYTTRPLANSEFLSTVERTSSCSIDRPTTAPSTCVLQLKFFSDADGCPQSNISRSAPSAAGSTAPAVSGSASFTLRLISPSRLAVCTWHCPLALSVDSSSRSAGNCSSRSTRSTSPTTTWAHGTSCHVPPLSPGHGLLFTSLSDRYRCQSSQQSLNITTPSTRMITAM